MTDTAGTRLYAAVTADFDLAEHELTQLREACRLVDLLDALEQVVADEGAVRAGADGLSRPHPALAELRQQRITLARLLAALRIPEDDEGRAQRRTGVRGPYRLKVAQ
ncbi:MAG: hypothetical protein U0R68_13405 [Candidatus Nanopelagicales bacterium]